MLLTAGGVRSGMAAHFNSGVCMPALERDGPELVSQGLLDSTTWEALRGFYADPLDVPGGELRYLCDLVGECLDDLPTGEDGLAVYQPWTEARIRRFFEDYPRLRCYEPLLSFESGREAYRVRTGLRIYRGNAETPPSRTASFNASARGVVDASGRMTFGERSGRWQRRRIRAESETPGRLTIGNFSRSPASGLIFGVFRAPRRETVGPRENWLFGGMNTWNGIAWDRRWSGVNAGAFYHHGAREHAAGMVTTCEAPAWAVVHAGVAGLAPVGGGEGALDTALYAHGGVVIRGGGFRARLHGSLNADDPRAVPAAAAISLKGSNQSMDISVVHMPAGYRAPLSAVRRRLRNDLGVDSVAGGDAAAIDIGARHEPANWFSWFPRLSYAIGGGVSSLKAGFGVAGRGYADYRVSYLFHPRSSFRDEYHSLTTRLRIPGTTPVYGFWRSGTYLRPGAYRSVGADIGCGFSPVPAADMRLWLEGFHSSAGSERLSLGMEQSLRLFEKTNAGVEVWIPLVEMSDEGVACAMHADFYL